MSGENEIGSEDVKVIESEVSNIKEVSNIVSNIIKTEGLEEYMKRPHFTLDYALILVKKTEGLTPEKRDELEKLIKALKKLIKNGEEIPDTLQISNGEKERIPKVYEEVVRSVITTIKNAIYERESRCLDLEEDMLHIVLASGITALVAYFQRRFGTPSDPTIPLAGFFGVPSVLYIVDKYWEEYRREKEKEIENTTHIPPEAIEEIVSLAILPKIFGDEKGRELVEKWFSNPDELRNIKGSEIKVGPGETSKCTPTNGEFASKARGIGIDNNVGNSNENKIKIK